MGNASEAIQIISYGVEESAGTQQIAATFQQFIQGRSVLTHAITAQAPAGGRIARIDIYDGEGAEAGWIHSETPDAAALSDHRITEQTPVASGGACRRRLVLTDERGQRTEQTLVFNVTEYRKPQLYTYELRRADASGNLVSSGTRVYQFQTGYLPSIKLDGVEKNPFSCSTRFRPVGADTWKQVASTTTRGEFVRNILLNSLVTVDADVSYEFEFTLTDFFFSVSRTAILSRGYKLISLHESGQGVAIGQVAETNGLFDVALPARFRSDLSLDSPLPPQSGGTGVASLDGLKSALGMGTQFGMQCGRTPITINANTTSQLITINYPEPFAAAPRALLVTLETTAGVYQAQVSCAIFSSSAAKFQIACGNTGTAQRTPVVNWLAIE